MDYPHGGASQIWRDGPGEKHNPDKPEVREYLGFLEKVIRGFASGNSVHVLSYGEGPSAAQAALDDTRAKVIDFSGFEFEQTDTLIVSRGDVVIRNLTLSGDISGSTETRRPNIIFRGEIEDGIALAADVPANASSVRLASAEQPLVVDQWCRVRSDHAPHAGITLGEIRQVKSVVSDNGEWLITFYEQLYLPYGTADNARLEPMQMLQNIVLESPKVKGETTVTDQTGIKFEACTGVVVSNPETQDCRYGHGVFEACGEVDVFQPRMVRAGEPNGLNYGWVASNATYRCRIHHPHALDMRHGADLGGAIGYVTHFEVYGGHLHDMAEAGVGTHPQVIFTRFKGVTVSVRKGLAGNAEGIICQGIHFRASGCRVVDPTRHGILHQRVGNIPGVLGSTLIEGNEAVTSQGSTAAVAFMVSTDAAGGDMGRCILRGNGSRSFAQVALIDVKGGTTKTALCSENHGDASLRGQQIRCHAGAVIETWGFDRCSADTAGGSAEAFYVQELAGGEIGNGRLSSNTANCDGVAFRISGAGDVVTDGANMNNGAGAMWSLAGNDSIRIDEDLYGEAVIDVPELAPGESVAFTITVDEARPGDAVLGISPTGSLFGDLVVIPEGVVGNDTVRFRVKSESLVARDPASGIWRAYVRKK